MPIAKKVMLRSNVSLEAIILELHVVLNGKDGTSTLPIMVDGSLDDAFGSVVTRTCIPGVQSFPSEDTRQLDFEPNL